MIDCRYRFGKKRSVSAAGEVGARSGALVGCGPNGTLDVRGAGLGLLPGARRRVRERNRRPVDWSHRSAPIGRTGVRLDAGG